MITDMPGVINKRFRYIVASYLVHDLKIDWRVGADWFEHILIDHDVCSNYGEWASMANVACAAFPLGLKGHGPKGRTKAGAPWANGVGTRAARFDPYEQQEQYDRDGSYVRRWASSAPALAVTGS